MNPGPAYDASLRCLRPVWFRIGAVEAGRHRKWLRGPEAVPYWCNVESERSNSCGLAEEACTAPVLLVEMVEHGRLCRTRVAPHADEDGLGQGGQ